jgi:hypothetical protein
MFVIFEEHDARSILERVRHCGCEGDVSEDDVDRYIEWLESEKETCHFYYMADFIQEVQEFIEQEEIMKERDSDG